MKINPITNKIFSYNPTLFSAEKKTAQTYADLQKNSNLPSVYATGQSQINSNLPISYTKLGEIEIPGLKDKASVFQLANGQKVIIAKKKGPAYIKTTYNVGSMNETEDIRGISHFIEHNLFNGSKELAPREYDKQVADLGAYTNASTSFSVTDYYLSLQLLDDTSLEKAIRLNAQQTQFPTFPTEQLEKEKEPVKSEIDMYKDMPDDVASNIVLKNLFNVNTKSTNFILGTKENINSFNRDKVFDYYNTWYTPDNAVTVITGDVDTNETIQFVSKYFNKKNDYSKINQRHSEPVFYTNRPIREDIIRPNSTTASVTMGFALPEGTTNADKDKVGLLLGLLTSTTSDLSKELNKKGLTLNYYTEKMQNKPNGASAVMLTVDAPEEQIEQVIKTLYTEINKLSNNPVAEKNLSAIKKRFINNINSISESSGNLNATLTEMAMNNDYNYFNGTINNINNATAQDLASAARRFFDLNRVSMCVSHEKSATVQSLSRNYSALNLNNTVSFGASTNPKSSIKEITSDIKEYRLPNNIETTFISGNESAKSSIWLQMKTDDLKGVSASAFMVLNELLNRGTQLKSRDEYNDILNSNDINIEVSANTTGLNVSADFQSNDIATAVNMINELLLYPNLTETEFTRAKNVVKDLIQSEEISAKEGLYAELYPEIRQYESKEIRLQELDALTLGDIKNLYSLILSTSSCCAALTGKTDINTQSTVNNGFNCLPVFKPYSTNHSANYYIYKPITQGKIITKADEKAQAEIIQAYKYKRSENVDDIAKIEILNTILGGTMSSRLFTDLRENKKLAYHVSSRNYRNFDTGTIELNIGTTTDSPDPKEGSPKNINTALESFKHNIELLKSENVSQKELDNAKNHYKSNILDLIETNTTTNSMYNMIKNSLYGIGFFEQLLTAIDKITADDIRNTANYLFQHPPVTSIVASKKTLESLNLI